MDGNINRAGRRKIVFLDNNSKPQMSFTVDLVGFDTIGEKLNSLAKEKFTEVGAQIESSMKTMVQKAKRDAPKDVGQLAGAISYHEISPLEFEMVCAKHYAAFMEFGTKGRYQPIPGIDASKFKSAGRGFHEPGEGFFDAILEWVKRKGFAATKTKSGKASKSLDSTIAQEQAAFAIYLSIMRHGVKPHPFFFKQMTEEQPQLINRLQQIL